tara:strand:+ start:519 stop:779 length:261 start_codon:yes stop_codon:yes gene_type:complete
MEAFGWLQDWWPQAVALAALIFVMARTKTEIHELRKDVDDIQSRNTYAEHIRLRAEFDAVIKQQEKNISALWEAFNSLRNGKRYGD